MKPKGIWYVDNDNRFLVFFENEDSKKKLKDIFLSEYNPNKGFGIFPAPKNYKIFTNAYVFGACTFPKYGEPIGLKITSVRPITQKDTIEAAVKRVQVVGLPTEYFCLKRERTPDIYNNGATELLSFVDTESSFVGSNSDTNKEEQYSFLNKHEEIIGEKKKYEENHLFTIKYSAVEDKLQNTQDGVLYGFSISEDDEDSLSDKLTENTGVQITSSDNGQAIKGIIVEYNDGVLYVKFHKLKDSYNRIAPKGEITERSNPEYNYKIEALQLLKKDLSPNKYLLDILADRILRPLHISRHYFPHNVKEKDGTMHPNVTPSQKDAIEKALNAEDFLLVQGPPGTGKTTIITEMIEDFVHQGLRVLICSKNNLAVDNVLEKCQNLYYDKAKKKKMQCLRIGNEEKVLPSVHSCLPRPLTLMIQNDIKEQSENKRTEYLNSEQAVLNQYNKAVKDTDALCELIKIFLGEKETFQRLYATFQQSKLTFVLGKTKKEQFLYVLNNLSQQIDALAWEMLDLIKTEKVDVKNETLQLYLEHAHETYNEMERLKQEIEKAAIRYGFILGNERENTINEIDNLNLKKEQILKSICILKEYKGNPAVEVIKLPAQNDAITASYFDELFNNIESYIEKLKSRRLLLKRVLDEWQNELQNDQSSLEEPLLRTVNIIGATCIGVNTKPNFKNIEYDVAIVDEAGQITLHDLLVPLVKAKKTILIGDHLQLPPNGEADFCNYIKDNNLLGFKDANGNKETVKYFKELNKVFSVSLFEELFEDSRFNNNKVMLDTQFRMHPDIAEYISNTFYDGKYKSGVSKEARSLKIAGFTKPMYFVDTYNSEKKHENRSSDPTVRVNSFEADICADYLAKIIIAIENGDYEAPKKNLKLENGEYDIGVITAYKKQTRIIKSKLQKRLKEYYEAERANDIVSRLAINTLDSFQGRDNQIILYSFVRSNSKHQIGFLNEVRRLNVMMTRAKSLLIMIGDSETLTKSKSNTVHDSKKASQYYKSLVDYCKGKCGYIDYAKEG